MRFRPASCVPDRVAVVVLYTVACLLLVGAGATGATAGTICGQVHDRESGLPVAGAAVIVRDAAGAPLGPVGATATDGSFCIDGLAPGTYVLEVRVDDYLVAWVSGVVVTADLSSVPITGTLPPFAVAAPWPNPASAEVNFSIAVNRQVPLRVTVYDLRGRLVKAWSTAAAEVGARSYRWDGRDASGRTAPSGQYLLRVHTRGYTVDRRIILTR